MGALGKSGSVTGTAQSDVLGGYARLNLATTIAGFVFSVVIGLWFTPFLVHSLGPAAYGLIPLATTVVSYFSLLSQALGATLMRSISMALASRDTARANRAFGIALGGALILSGLVAVPLAVVAWWAPVLFDSPPGSEAGVQILFGIVALSFVIALVATPYQTVSFARNRIYLNNIATMVQTLIRVGGTVALFYAAATIVNAGLAILISGVLALLINVAFARISVPELSSFTLAIDRAELKALSRTSSHVLLMQVGTVMAVSSELVIVNRLFGLHEGGRYAAVMQWLLLLRNATIALVVLFVPTILALAGERRFADLIAYTKRSMTLVALCVALPTGYLCGLSPLILAVWLGYDFASLWPVMVVQLAPLAIVSCVVPLYSITLSMDRVRLAGLVQIGTALTGIGLGVALGSTGWPALVAAGVGWSMLLKEVVFTPAYAARNIDAPPTTFLPPLGVAALAFVAAAVLSWGVGALLHPTTLIGLGLTGVVVTACYGVGVAVAMPLVVRQAFAGLRLPGFRKHRL